MEIEVTVVLLVLFLALSAFFSSSETAFFALQRIRVAQLRETGVPRSDRLARLKDNPERFLSTVLLGNNAVNLALASIVTALAFDLIGGSRGLGVVIATVVTTVGIVIIGEAVPKTIAARYPEQLLFLFLRPLEVAQWVLFPLAAVLQKVSAGITRPFSKPSGAAPSISEEELRTLVRLGTTEGEVEQTEAEFIHRAFGFGDLQAREIMTPRPEIVFLSKDATFADFLQVYAEESHTRFPVYESAPDNVVGTLSSKDVLRAYSERALTEDDPIAPLVREPYFYPETKHIDDLFVEMRAQGAQMVMLIDEFGVIAGLLTVKQIVGEVVGKIVDADEDSEQEVETIDERTFQVDAGMRVDEANERLHLGLPDEEGYETLAGFVLATLGRIPRDGEQVRAGGLRLTVSEMDGVKIEKILVTRPPDGSPTPQA